MNELLYIVVGYAFAFLIICSYCLGRFVAKNGGKKNLKRTIIVLIFFFSILPIYLETIGVGYIQEDYLQSALTVIHPFLVFILPLMLSIPSRSMLKKIAKVKRSF